MTTRERREAKADRLRGWADGREAKAEAAGNASRAATEGIPFGQPILVGHHSQRRHERAIERAQAAATASVENSRKADEMRSRAANIEAQNRAAVFSDDADAIDRLKERVAKREQQREQMKAANAAFKKANREALKAMSAYERGQAIPFPSFTLTNLGATIRRDRERIAQLEREAINGKPDRIICARFASACEDCGAAIEKGQTIRYNRDAGARCRKCEA